MGRKVLHFIRKKITVFNKNVENKLKLEYTMPIMGQN